MKDESITASFISLGCFKNVVDTEVLGGLLERRNIELVSAYEKSDWIIINTCGFIRDAKEESIDEILSALEKKDAGDVKHVALFGCLTQRYHDELKKNFGTADIIWGVNDIEELADLIASSNQGAYQDKKPFLYNENFHRIITTFPNFTFIKISEGCNMLCSFCAIPQIRGAYRSRTINSIIKESQKYKQLGFQEINLISQNSTFFGKDRDEESQLPRLLEDISSLDFKTIRVLYLMPEEMTQKIIDAFSYPSINHYFDLPFQHVSKSLLKQMKRGGSYKQNLELIENIRNKYPDAVIRSSFIVGFPGETEENFEELCKFAIESKIERIGVFGYSDEENTSAFKLKNKVPEKTIKKRVEMLQDISDRNIIEYNKKIVDTTCDFLPQGPCPWDNQSTIGRIRSQSPETDGLTLVNKPFDDRLEMYTIKIVDYKNEMLYGEVP
jgi:ribosomal protein S12 methylthiotransferase